MKRGYNPQCWRIWCKAETPISLPPWMPVCRKPRWLEAVCVVWEKVLVNYWVVEWYIRVLDLSQAHQVDFLIRKESPDLLFLGWGKSSLSPGKASKRVGVFRSHQFTKSLVLRAEPLPPVVPLVLPTTATPVSIWFILFGKQTSNLLLGWGIGIWRFACSLNRFSASPLDFRPPFTPTFRGIWGCHSWIFKGIYRADCFASGFPHCWFRV